MLAVYLSVVAVFIWLWMWMAVLGRHTRDVWLAVASCGWLWLAVAGWAGCMYVAGWLWLAVAGCGWLWLAIYG
jgi:hypothetical protein